MFESGGIKLEVGNKWAQWLHNPCRMVASKTLQSKGQDQNWSTAEPTGYITLAIWRVPDASKRVGGGGVAPKWAGWLHNPCRLGGPRSFVAGDKIKTRSERSLVA